VYTQDRVTTTIQEKTEVTGVDTNVATDKHIPSEEIEKWIYTNDMNILQQ